VCTANRLLRVDLRRRAGRLHIPKRAGPRPVFPCALRALPGGQPRAPPGRSPPRRCPAVRGPRGLAQFQSDAQRRAERSRQRRDEEGVGREEKRRERSREDGAIDEGHREFGQAEQQARTGARHPPIAEARKRREEEYGSKSHLRMDSLGDPLHIGFQGGFPKRFSGVVPASRHHNEERGRQFCRPRPGALLLNLAEATPRLGSLQSLCDLRATGEHLPAGSGGRCCGLPRSGRPGRPPP